MSSAAEPIPWLLMGDSRRRVLQSAMADCVAAWWREWSTAACGAIEVQIDQAAAAGGVSPHAYGGTWVSASIDQVLKLRLHAPVDVVPVLLSNRVDACLADRNGDISRGVRSDALRSLCSALLGKAGCASGDLSETQSQPARVKSPPGWLLVRIAAAKLEIELLVHPQIALRMLDEKPAARSVGEIGKRRAALGSESIRVEAQLGSVEVTLGDLAAMAEGDVIVLDQPLSQPGSLLTSEGSRIAGATLGRSGSQRAVCVARDQ